MRVQVVIFANDMEAISRVPTDFSMIDNVQVKKVIRLERWGGVLSTKVRRLLVFDP
jgi:hypothetical protein